MSSYIPFPLVSDIVRRIGISCFRNLGTIIAAGPELVSIVFSDEVLKEVCLDEFITVSSLCIEGSPYRPFLLRCLQSDNNTAKYIEGLRLAALVGPSVQALNKLQFITYTLILFLVFFMFFAVIQRMVE